SLTARPVRVHALSPYTTLFRSGGDETEELVLGHDLAVRAEPARVGDRMAVPGDGPRRELVNAHVADEHLVRGVGTRGAPVAQMRSEEHTSELQSPDHLVCRLLL